MDYLLSIISGLADDPAAVQLIFASIVALAVILFAYAILYLLSALFGRERARVDEQVNSAREAGERQTQSWLAVVSAPIARIAVPKQQKEFNKTKARLSYAGYRSDNAVGVFYAIKLVAMLGLPIIIFGAASFIPGLTQFQVILAAWAGAAIGVIVPNRILASQVAARQKRLRDGFPDALDFLVVCSEAGLGLDAAIKRVADELVVSHPELADELRLVGSEMRVGIDRGQCLRNLVIRNGVEDLRGFVATLSQAMRFGSSVSETLRIYAEEFRDKRMQRAEEVAAKLPIKMIFPLALCLLPAFMIIALGPSVITVYRAFGK
jgi:tight adherence protein C